MKRALLILVACSTSSSSSIDPEAIRRACAMEISCLLNPPGASAGSCVFEWELGIAQGRGISLSPEVELVSRFVGCAGASSNCTDTLNCASRDHGPDWCNANPEGGCEGDLLIGCASNWGLQITDCAAFGLHCAGANGFFTCSDGKACDPAAAATHCDGNRLITCDGQTQLEASVDCGALISGGTCNTMSGGCHPPASPGCASDGVTCQGTTAVVCYQGGQQQIACGDFASHCALASQNPYCDPDATECADASPDSCVGNSLQMCVNGKLERTPCSSIGLTTCQTVAGVSRCQ